MQVKISDYFGSTFLFGNMNQSFGSMFVIGAIVGSLFLEDEFTKPVNAQLFTMIFQGFLLMGIGSIGVALGQIMKLMYMKRNDFTDE